MENSSANSKETCANFRVGRVAGNVTSSRNMQKLGLIGIRYAYDGRSIRSPSYTGEVFDPGNAVLILMYLPGSEAMSSASEAQLRVGDLKSSKGPRRVEYAEPCAASLCDSSCHTRNAAQRLWSPVSPETTFQKFRKATAAASVHHVVPSCLIPSSGSSSSRQVSRMRFRIAFQSPNGNR